MAYIIQRYTEWHNTDNEHYKAVGIFVDYDTACAAARGFAERKRDEELDARAELTDTPDEVTVEPVSEYITEEATLYTVETLASDFHRFVVTSIKEA